MTTPFPTIPYHRPRLDAHAAVAKAREFLDTVRLRRSIRDFSSDPVPMEAIRFAVAAAASAPSGANMQPWRFVIVTDSGLKQKIRVAAEEEERENYGGRMPEEWLRALAPLQTDWRKEFLEVAPVLIAVFKEDYGVGPDGRKITHYYVNESVGLACGFRLAA